MKKNNSGACTPSRMRRMRFGWYAVLLTVVVIAAVAVLNIVIDAAEQKWALKIDASPNQLTSFSDQTYSMLDALDQDVHIHLLIAKGDTSQHRIQVEEIVAKYRVRSAHISVDTIDPETEPNRVNGYKASLNDANTTLPSGSIIVTSADERRVKLIPASELYGYSQNAQTGEVVQSAFAGEGKLTQAIKYVTSETLPMVYFLSGHDEATSEYCTMLAQVLRDDNLEVSDLTLGQGTAPKPGDVLVVIGPQLDITDAEYQILRTFLDDGGRMLIAEDAQIDMGKTPNFVKLLAYYGIQYKDGLVVEGQSQTDRWLSTQIYIVPKLDTEHAITKDAGSVRLILPNSRAISRTDMPLAGWSYDELLTTSGSAYIKSRSGDSDLMTIGPDDEVGMQSLAVAVQYQPDAADRTKDTRIVAMGNLYALIDSDLMQSSHNMLFALSTFNWLVDREDNTYIRSKALASTALNIPNQSSYLMLSGLVVIALPLLVLIFGIGIYLKRRRL